MVFPFGEATQIVFANDDFKILVGMFFLQVHQCMDGVAGLWQVKFNVGNLELVIVMNGRPHHIVTVVFVKQSFARLKRVLGGNNKPNLFEVSAFGHQVRDDEMAHVDGIERTEEETNFHETVNPLKGTFSAKTTHRNF